MIKLVVFDLDGTLADTLKDLGTAMNVALSGEDLPGYSMEEYRHLVGNGIDRLVRDTMADAYTPEGAVRVKAAFQAYYADHCRDFTVAYDGVEALLNRLTADGIATAVISNKPNQFVPEILSALYPHHSFLGAWGQRDEFPRKPSPDNAGVKVCGVSWGFRGAAELREAGADYIVNSAEELYNLIHKKDNQ